MDFKGTYLGLIQKENLSESSNSPSSRIHSSAMFNFALTLHHSVVPSTLPTRLITLLRLHLCLHTSSHCCVFYFARILHGTIVSSSLPTPFITLLCLQFCPHPLSHQCIFNFAHTPHHTVVPSSLPSPFITLLCLQLCPHPSSHCWVTPSLGHLSHVQNPGRTPSLHHSPRQSVLIVKCVVPSRTVVCNQR